MNEYESERIADAVAEAVNVVVALCRATAEHIDTGQKITRTTVASIGLLTVVQREINAAKIAAGKRRAECDAVLDQMMIERAAEGEGS